MAEKTFVDQLCEILVKNRVITQAEARAYHEQFESSDHDSFEFFLYDEGLVSKKDLLTALSSYYRLPAVDVEGYFFDSELLQNFPEDFLIRNECIPLELDEDILVVATANPANENLVAAFGDYVSTDVQFQVGLAQDILDAINEYYEKSVTEISEDIDLDEERREQEEFERDGQITDDEA